jgi:hypothetical protein
MEYTWYIPTIYLIGVPDEIGRRPLGPVTVMVPTLVTYVHDAQCATHWQNDDQTRTWTARSPE